MDSPMRSLNINVGILGHVDSGKTSLVKALSTSLSTAALDKNPQSQQRGITLDLGFSAFTLPIPDHLQPCDYDFLQFTLVDCPGHASLIRTIIGGAQIIDLMVLVVDANKGIQTQTAECIVIGEITTNKLIIALNKIDMIPEDDRVARLQKVTKRIKKVFGSTKFSDAPIVETAAAVGGEKVASIGAAHFHSNHTTSSSTSPIQNSEDYTATFASTSTIGVDKLIEIIRESVTLPHRNANAPFYYAIDHCFAIRGHGTVITGTVLNGSISVNGILELPQMGIQRKVKSMQMFHRPVKTAQQGDRVGICITNLDPQLVERGIAAAPGTVSLLTNVLCLVRKVRFYKFPAKSGSKFHISVGHSTVLSTVTFFGAIELQSNQQGYTTTVIDSGTESSVGLSLSGDKKLGFPTDAFTWETDYLSQAELVGSDDLRFGREPLQWALISFQQPIHCPIGSLIIGSKLDVDTSEHNTVTTSSRTTDIAGEPGTGKVSTVHQCRLAFYGPIRESLTDDDISRVRIYFWKSKEGQIFRLNDVRLGLSYEVIGAGMFSDANGVQAFLGMRVEATETGREGVISGPFGSDGKFKVKFSKGTRVSVGGKLMIRFKRFVHDKSKSMIQSASRVDDGPDELPDNPALFAADAAAIKPKREKKKQQNLVENKAFVPPVDLVASNVQASSIASSCTDAVRHLETQATSSATVSAAVTTSPTNSATVSASSVGSRKLNSAAGAPNHSDPCSATPIKLCSSAIKGEAESVDSTTTKNLYEVRFGIVDSVKKTENETASGSCAQGEDQVIVRDAFRVEENIRTYVGSIAVGNNGEEGEVVGPYAKMGKCKLRFPSGFRSEVGSKVEIRLHSKVAFS